MNLLPPLNGDLRAAKRMRRRLFAQFARKLVDLWKYEAGEPIASLFTQYVGWENFEKAQGRGKGILLLTIHVGNWEFGAAILKQKGIDIEVITLAEPDPTLTRLREAARARWGIPTRVIGEDQFAFVDVIRRLNDGATIALLMDRPPLSTGVEVDLFQHPFQASISAAELARASGCSLVPAYLPRVESGYAAHILPVVEYDRASLQGREKRTALTQKIMRVFEPVIREHLDQWYHFVPIWPERSC